MAINFIKKEDLSHITRTTRQWETTIDRYEIIPKGVLCIELCNDKLTKIKIGNGHLIYEQLPYVSDVNLSDYYTKEETNTLLKNLKSIKIKGEASSLSDLPLRGNEDGDLWFVNKPHPDTHSRYDEYVWYNNKWESFGSSDIDLSEYAKKSYVDEHIQEVQNEITEIIESGYLHKHDNKNILDHTSAVYNVEKDNKLRDLHNYDDTELREKAHTHLNKNILDQTDAVYNRDKDDKLELLHNYDDTTVKQRLSSLESVSHSHSNLDVLNRTTAAFTREQALTLLDCKDFKGTDGVHDGYHGFVPAPTKDDVGKVLGANGQWVEGGSSGGDVVTQGGGISITTDAQTGNKVISVNAGTGLEIDQQTGELNVTATGGDTIAEGGGISIETDQQTGVKTISVNVGDNLEVDQVTGELNVTGVDYEAGNGIRIGSNYNFLEYIKNSGNYDQIILTDILPKFSDALEVDVMFGAASGLDSNREFIGTCNYDGASTVGDPFFYGMYVFNDNIRTSNITFYNHFVWTPQCTNTNFIDNPYGIDYYGNNPVRQIARMQGSTGSWGNVSRDFSDQYRSDFVDPFYPMAIFGSNHNNDDLYQYICGEITLYGVKLYDSLGTLIHDLRPVERVSDNAAGVYDVITNKFYGNAGGGSFVKGPVITTSDRIINAKIGNGLQFDSNNEIEINIGEGLQFDSNDAIEVNVGDGLSINASNEVELDKATTSAIGGVIVGDNIDVNNGTISVPKAASNKLGVVKPSDGLSVDSNGVLTIDTGDGLSIDSTTKEVNVNVGVGLSIDGNNNIILDPATANTLGGVKIGEGLDVAQDGTVSLAGGSGGSYYVEGNGIEMTAVSSDIPEGYAAISYIESNGNQWTQLDYTITHDTRVVLDMASYETETTGRAIFGSRQSSNPQFVTWLVGISGSDYIKTTFVYGSNAYDHYYDTTVQKGTRFTLDASVNGLYINNTLIQSITDQGNMPTDKLGLFAVANGDGTYETSKGIGKYRIYSAKIYDGNTLMMDLVPVVYLDYTHSTKVPGLYDLINDDFYPSLTATPFIYKASSIVYPTYEVSAKLGHGLQFDENDAIEVNVGDGLVIDSNDNTLNVNIGSGLEIDSVTGAINVIGGGGNSGNYIEGEAIEFEEGASRLPTGYTELENISNVSASYIDTGYMPNTDTQLSIIANIHRGTTSWQTLFGARDAVNPGGTEYAFFVRLNDNYNFYPRITGDQYTYMPSQTYDEKIRININNTTATVTRQDGSSYSYTQTGSLSNLSTTLAIFALHNQTGYVDNGIIDLYSFKIYENNTIVKDFVPCKRNSDDAIGLIDIINNVFYTNLGTGTFTAGRILTNTSINVKYGDGLSVNTSNELEVNVGDGLQINQDGEVEIDPSIIPDPYEAGDGIEIIGTTHEDEFRVLNQEYFFDTHGLTCGLNARIWTTINDGDILAAMCIHNNGGNQVPLFVGLTEDSVKVSQNYNSNILGPNGSFDYLGKTWYFTADYALSGTDGQDTQGHIQTLPTTYSFDSTPSNFVPAAKDLIDLAVLLPDVLIPTINAKIGAGLQFDTNGAIEVDGGSGDSIDEGGGITITTDQQTGVKTIGVNAGIGLDIDLVTGELFVNGQLPEGTIIKKLTYVGDGSTTNSNIHFSKKPLSILSLNGSTGQNYGSVISTPIDAPYLHGVWGGSGGSGTAFRSSMSYDDTTNTLSIQNSSDVGLAFNLSGTTYTMFYLTKGHTGSGTSETNEISVIRSFTYVGDGAGTIDIQFAETPDMIVSIHGPTSDGFITSSPVPITSTSIAGIFEYGSASRYGGVVSCGMSFNDSTNILTLSGGVDAGARFNISGAIYTVTYSVNETLSASLLNPGNGIDIDSENEISVKIGNHLSFDQTTGDINVDDIIAYYGGAATEVVNSAEFTIDKIRWTVSAIRSNSGSEIWIQLRYFGFYDDSYNRFQVSSGVSTWSDGSTVEYYQNRTIESLIANTERLCAKTWNGVRTFAMTFNLTYDISSDDLKYFRYYTGDDESGRDPVSWTIEVHDKEADTWTQVQTVTGATVPTGRNQWTSYFDLNLPPSDGKKINVLVGDGLFIDSTNNDVNVKIGQALSINNSNEIDVNLGRALSINNNNEIDVDIATATSLGVVKAGSGLNIDEFGNLSTQAAPYRIGRALSLDDESVRLPAGYAKAKYVENPSNAGIRTGFRPSDYPNAKYTASVSVESIGSSSTYPTRYLCGASGWTGALKMPLDGISGGLPIKTFFYIGNGNNPSYTTTTFQLGERFDFEASPAGGFKINNELVQAVATPPSNFGTYYFTLFGSGASNGTGEPGPKGRIYYFRIYNTDDTLLANFVPAVRLGDNVVGFYNTVNNTFYSSETSTAFTTDMDDLDVDEPDWVLNANIATSNSLGVVKPSTGLVVNAQGALTLDKASASTLGGVKVGNNLSIDSNGVLSANIINYSAGHAIEIVGDLSIDKFRWEITANAGDSMVAFRYFEYSDSDHIAFTIQNGTIEWSNGSTVSYPSGYDETFAGMMENRTKCTVTGWGGSKTLIMTFRLSQSIMLSDIAYFRWKTDDYMGGRQPTEFNIYAHDSINDEWILLKEVTDHSLVPSSSNTWSNYIEIEPEIEPGSISVKYGDGLTVNQNNELEVPIASSNTLGIVKIGHGVEIDPYGAINVEAMVPFVAGVGLELIPGSSSVDALPEGYGKVDYIETNGSAYTIINYVPNRNSKVVGTAMFRTDNSDPVVFGCRKGGGDGQQFVLWFDGYSSAQAKVGFVYGTNTWSTSTDAANGKLITYTTGEQFSFLISVDDDCNINNTFVHNITDKGAPASDLHLGIFALAVTNSSIESDDTIFNGRMYDFKIYENDELVVNLVPAVRLLDEKVGFYDNINDVFYTSFSSSNQFITDMSSMVIDYRDTTMNVRLSEGLKTNASNDITLDLHAGNGINIDAYGSVLPTGYGELSYIEGNGNQWTQLNYYPTHDSRLVVDCISYETKETDRALFGCREGTGGQPQFVLWMGQEVSGKVTSSFVYGSNVWDDDYDTGISPGVRFTIDASYNGVYINGNLFESITDQGNMPNLKVALFTVGNGDGSYISGKGMGKYRIFSFKIYEGNDLVVDLRPALSPNRIPGFYDVVNDAFYSSLTSTAFVYDSGSVVYPSGLQITTKLGDGLAYDANGAITIAESADAFAPGDGISFTNEAQSNKIKLVISAIKNTSQSGVGAPYIQMRNVEFSDENMDPISITSGEAIWTDGTTVSYASSSETISAMIADTAKMCVEHFTQPLILTFTLSSPVYSESIKYFRYKTGNDASERDPVSWKIYVNDVNAQTKWNQISEGVSETITGNRDTWTQYFDCEYTAGGTTYINVVPATANTIGGIKVGNGLTVTSDGTISTATGKAYIAGEGINMSSSQYEFSAENEQYLFKSQVTCELHGSFNREFQKTTDDTALGIIWNVYDSGTLWSGPIFVGLSSDAVKYTTNSTTYSALGTFSYLGKTWYYSDHSMYVSNIDGTDYDGNMVVDTETSASTSELVDFCKSLIDRARVILKVDEISLLPATEDTLGGIKIGEGLSIDENNVVSSTVYEEGQGIIFETSGSTDSFDVKNKEYYFEEKVSCQISGNFGPRTFTRLSDEPCLMALMKYNTTWCMPIIVGLTAESVDMSQSWDGTILHSKGTLDYKGYTWYVNADYGLSNGSMVDLMGNLQTLPDMYTYDSSSYDAFVAELMDAARDLIDLAELISPGIKTYDVWNTGTGWLNGAYISGTSDTFATDWYKEYHSDNTEYFELPKGATEVKLTGISTSDTVFGGNHIDLFNDSKHHIGTFIGESQWYELLPGTVYLQFGVKWSENNDRNISASDIKSVTLEIKVPKNNAITAKLGDGLTFDEDDAITLDESIKLIIHCVGDPLT